MTATYSPEDNKLRLYSTVRLDQSTYERIKAAGFGWAPKQDLFVAPMWTPARADLLVELCGEIGDEDTSLVDRAEQRADRFDGYRSNRLRDANAAHDAVHNIAQRFEAGQPILVGHHSQRRAERDKERMDRKMAQAVQMWDTAEYWQRRAAGALRNAKYKERPDVRYRRMKSIEADKRKAERGIEEAQAAMRLWAKVPRFEWDRQDDIAKLIAGRSTFHLSQRLPGDNYGTSFYSLLSDGRMKGDTAWRLAVEACERRIAHELRWVAHCENRLIYERAMLGEAGGLVATDPAVELEIGGRVLIAGEWLIIKRVNKKDGKAVSITTNSRYGKVRGVEEIKQYEAPTPEQAENVKKATKLPPLCNYAGPGFKHITKAEWDARHADYKGTMVAGQVRGALGVVLPLAEGDQPHRVRSMIVGYSLAPVFVTDMKVTEPPKVGAAPKGAVRGPWSTDRQAEEKPVVPAPEPDMPTLLAESERRAKVRAAREADPDRQKFEALRAAVKAGGVQVVAAPQLFPTPHELARRMVEEADLQPGMRVLEPSAGTGHLIGAMGGVVFAREGGAITAVEVNSRLADLLRSNFPKTNVLCMDFLELHCSPEALVDRVLMNPPFVNGEDIKHIRHAMKFLKPGGRLVAVCAAGPRQKAALEPIADTWEELPQGTFAEAGTNVRTALLTITAKQLEALPC
jgi:protein-L-isoaspartate O-methyltransferase